MKLKIPVAAAFFIGGIVLLYFGFTEADSFMSDVSEAFTGSPTDRSMWLIGGGAVSAAFGAFLALSGGE